MRVVTGKANEMRPALNLILWNRSEGIRSHEHIRVDTGETRGILFSAKYLHMLEFMFVTKKKSTIYSFCPASDLCILGEETYSCKKLLVPYVADGRYNEAQFRNLVLSHDNSEKEGTFPSNEKQIIPYACKRGKKTSNKEHNPSSVYDMQGAIVPHPKSLNSKKKMLGRVNLDPRDITLWQLAIQKGSNFSKEKVDDDTWWANERKIFLGRINAFTAMMHVILGKSLFM